jgi:hypothetical protein
MYVVTLYIPGTEVSHVSTTVKHECYQTYHSLVVVNLKRDYIYNVC